MNTKYYRNESWIDNTFSKRGRFVLSMMAVIFSVGFIAAGCGALQNIGFGGSSEPVVSEPVAQVADSEPVADVAPVVKEEEQSKPAEKNVEMTVDTNQASSMVAYDVTSIGRSDPFMPYDEIRAFDEARRSAYAEANMINSKIAEVEKMKNISVTDIDDINPYSFNLPVPPTALASADSAAATITRTKVVGIMYNKTSPTAIINVDEKDYLVRPGDQIIGQEYKVIQINPSWITVGMGANVYSASIGEAFSRDELDSTQNDIYNLKNRFGGRKS